MVSGAVRTWLRIEGLSVLALCGYQYWRSGNKWWVFAVCFFLPDAAMLGYLASKPLGAALYNCAHSYVGPVLLGIASVGRSGSLLAVALIWAAHIGFDRAFGYGLKLPTAFNDTHLGRVGRPT